MGGSCNRSEREMRGQPHLYRCLNRALRQGLASKSRKEHLTSSSAPPTCGPIDVGDAGRSAVLLKKRFDLLAGELGAEPTAVGLEAVIVAG